MEQVVDVDVAEKKLSAYGELCDVFNVEPFNAPVEITHFNKPESLASSELNERLTAALQVLVELVSNNHSTDEKIDKVYIDGLIARIDGMIAAQLDEIIHHPTFQEVESLWRSVDHLVSKTDFRSNIKLELLDVTKEDLIDDFEDATEVLQSGLYKHVYVDEYDTPGGEPFTAIVSPYEFTAATRDISLLTNIAKVSSAAHCPFLGNVSAKFFGKSSIEDVVKIEDIENYMEKAEYIKWNSFREMEDSRYIGLVAPQFLLRLPYGENNPASSFLYQEQVNGHDASKYLWGKAAFALAANMTRSFKDNGWCVNIRGPEGGGKVENLPLHQFNVGQGLQTKIPLEIMFSETREFALSELGFIPLSYYKNSDYACFFSANSTQKPQKFSSKEATSNAKINARLPYIFLSSRLAHYLKVIQRESIGSTKNKVELESELNRWISSLVTKMNNPSVELAATHPLKEGQVTVHDIPENPGFYSVSLHAIPHFQIEGMDVQLSMVAKLPTGKE